MLIRNWHKRNVRSAQKVEATAYVSNGGDQHPHVQVTARSERGRLLITMKPSEARKLIAELTHCVSRYEAP